MRGGRKGRPRGPELRYRPKHRDAAALLRLVEERRRAGWTLERTAREVFDCEPRSLHRWLAEELPVPGYVVRICRLVRYVGLNVKDALQLEFLSRDP